jgi:hypothetical protein
MSSTQHVTHFTAESCKRFAYLGPMRAFRIFRIFRCSNFPPGAAAAETFDRPILPHCPNATTPQTPVACCIFHIIKLLKRERNCFSHRTLATSAARPPSCNIMLHVAILRAKEFWIRRPTLAEPCCLRIFAIIQSYPRFPLSRSPLWITWRRCRR